VEAEAGVALAVAVEEVAADVAEDAEDPHHHQLAEDAAEDAEEDHHHHHHAAEEEVVSHQVDAEEEEAAEDMPKPLSHSEEEDTLLLHKLDQATLPHHQAIALHKEEVTLKAAQSAEAAAGMLAHKLLQLAVTRMQDASKFGPETVQLAILAISLVLGSTATSLDWLNKQISFFFISSFPLYCFCLPLFRCFSL